jgi:hypothetical protein
MNVRTASLCVLLVGAGGCLSSTHYIAKDELLALAAQAPETRGTRTRVSQAFAGADAPPDSYPAHSATHAHIDGGYHHHLRGGAAAAGGRSGGRPAGAALKNVDDAVVLIILAAAATVGLAATTGARYEGWVHLEPDHPIYLVGPQGEYTWVPLRELDVATASWAAKAYVRPQDGRWDSVERAPLDRRGLTWGMTLGAGEIAGQTGIEPGFLSHMQLGAFVTRELGLLADLGLGWRDASNSDTVYELRIAGEVQWFPLVAGKLHAGGFAQIGTAGRSDDSAGRDSSSSLLGAGALVQVDLSTHLALTGRAGITEAFGERLSDLGLGLTVY